MLSCIHSWGFDFLVKGLQRRFKWQFGDMYNYYSPCTIPPLKLSKKIQLVKSSYEISVKYLQSRCLLFMGMNRNISSLQNEKLSGLAVVYCIWVYFSFSSFSPSLFLVSFGFESLNIKSTFLQLGKLIILF